MDDLNQDTDAGLLYNQYGAAQPDLIIIPSLPGATAVSQINSVTGPTINFTSSVGFTFLPAGTNVDLAGTLTVAHGGTGSTTAGGARTNLGAAASGANADLNTFSALTGSSGWSAWTGGSDKTTHATYSGTASVAYVQAELQGVMDKLQQQTEAYKALVDTLLASGVIKA